MSAPSSILNVDARFVTSFGTIFVATFTTVLRLLLCAAAGIIARHMLFDAATSDATISGLAFVAAMVFLPCLLFSRMVTSFSTDLGSTLFLLVSLCAAQLIVGNSSAHFAVWANRRWNLLNIADADDGDDDVRMEVMTTTTTAAAMRPSVTAAAENETITGGMGGGLEGANLPGTVPVAGLTKRTAAAQSDTPEARFESCVMLGCTFQNAVSYPLSILESSPASVWFLTSDANRQIAQTFVFSYNLLTSLVLWSWGNYLVMSLTWRRRGKGHSTTAPTSGINARTSDSPAASMENTLPSAPGRPEAVVCPPPTPPPPATGASVPNVTEWLRWIHRHLIAPVAPFLSLPVLASLFGIGIALVPWLKQLFMDGPVMNVVLHGIATVADGTVPVYMVLLGVTVSGSMKEDDDGESRRSGSALAAGGQEHASQDAVALTFSNAQPGTSSQRRQIGNISHRFRDRLAAAVGPYCNPFAALRDFIRHPSHRAWLGAVTVVATVRFVVIPGLYFILFATVFAPQWRRGGGSRGGDPSLPLSVAPTFFASNDTTSPLPLRIAVTTTIAPSSVPVSSSSSGLFPDLAAMDAGRAATLLYTLMVELCCPSAINTLALLGRHGLSTTSYANCLVALYCVSIVTTGGWVYAALWLLR